MRVSAVSVGIRTDSKAASRPSVRREKVIVVTARQHRPQHTEGDKANADSNQILPYDDLGYSRQEHRSSTRRRRITPIPLGCNPHWHCSAGVRGAGCQWRQVPTVRFGCPVHRQPRRQLRYLTAELVSPIQQSHFWSALHRWRIGRARIPGKREIRHEMSISRRLILLWSVEDLVALWEAYEQRRAERVA
jgi:hypothetical protein